MSRNALTVSEAECRNGLSSDGTLKPISDPIGESRLSSSRLSFDCHYLLAATKKAQQVSLEPNAGIVGRLVYKTDMIRGQELEDAVLRSQPLLQSLHTWTFEDIRAFKTSGPHLCGHLRDSRSVVLDKTTESSIDINDDMVTDTMHCLMEANCDS